MNDLTAPSSPRRHALNALLLGAGMGVLASLVRVQLLMQLASTPSSLSSAPLLQMRLAQEYAGELYLALALGAAAGLVAWLAMRGDRAHWWLAVPVAGAAAWFSIVGGPWTAAARRIDLLPDGQLLSTSVLLLIACLAALALAGLVRAARFATPLPGKLHGGLACLVVLAYLALPVAYRSAWNTASPLMMTVKLVQREVALDEASWRVKDEHPAGAPRLGILTPSLDYRTDGGDLPSIIMPPPCVVEFEITEEDGEVHLDFAAGIDESVCNQHKGGEPLIFGFEVLVNGQRVFSSTAQAYKGKPANKIKWQRPAPDAPELDLEPGDLVTLRTVIVDKQRALVESWRPKDVGFGRVVLEKRERRKRLPSSPERPNIVLIVQDTMRADHSSLHDYAKRTTPALDALAARGISFREARSTSSWTWPSTASILTGLLPDEHGVTDDSACYLLGKNETLAEVLQARGYTTAAYSCNPLISRQKNFDQGFESFTHAGPVFLKSDKLIDELRAWIGMHAGTRFFLYLHLVDPHFPYEPLDEHLAEVGESVPEGFPGQQALSQYKKAALGNLAFDGQGKLKPEDPFPAGHIQQFQGLYDASIRTGDYYLQQLVEALDSNGLTQETIVVFTSDHGEEWMDHGLLTHGQSVHRELVHVPLVMAGPGLPSGVQSPTAVSNRHIAATLARIGGGEMQGAVDAIDLTAADAIPERAVFFATTHGRWNGRQGRQPIYGVREGDWVLHYAPEGSDFGVPEREKPAGGQAKLYEIASDPGETTDVSAQHPELSERLKLVILDSLKAQLDRQQGSVELSGGAATMKMLDGIGYTDDK